MGSKSKLLTAKTRKMNHIRNIIALSILVLFAFSCKKEVDNLKELDKVTAPTNLSTMFDITQDNSGEVTIIPVAEGVTYYKIAFGDDPAAEPTQYGLNEKITHIYEAGDYKVGITAYGLTGLSASIEADLSVSFMPPENLVVTIEKDPTNPAIVNVSATADYATVMDIYFGYLQNEDPVHALPGEVVSYTYNSPGEYTIKVVAKSGAEETIEHSEVITIEAASDPVVFPITFESPTVNYAFTDFGNATSTVIDNPDKSGINNSSKVAQTVKASGAETWAGSFLTMGEVIDFSTNKFFKVKVWSPKQGAVIKLKVENLDNGDLSYEADMTTTVANEWEELTYDFSAIDMANTYQKVVIFFDFGNVGDDAVYYFDDIKLTNNIPGTGIVGTWKMSPTAGSFGVGPEFGDMSWWAIDEAGVTDRACFFDDTYVFGADGTFSNVLGSESWIEDWQGGTNACGPLVAPHDGNTPATYNYSGGEVTLSGIGAYLGIPKAFNGGELTTPADAPESITYLIELTDNDNVMTVDINIGTGWWRFILVKEGGSSGSPIEGSWSMAPEAESLGVGPELGDISWWAIDDAGVAERACFYDDNYVFGADGSFSNVLGADTWVEDWQGGTNACGVPVAPHDGSASATFAYDQSAGTITINGMGAYLGIPKAYNGGELTSPDEAPASITYDVTLTEDNTVMTLDINIGSGWWRFKLVKN